MIVLGLLVSCLAIANGASLSSRVIGGSVAPDHKYPYLVSLRTSADPNNIYHFCGGAILNKHWILTAAHCVYPKLRDGFAVAGTNYLNEGGERYKFSFAVTHPNYSDFLHDDIALIRIKGSIEFNEHVQPVQLPSENFTEFSSPAAFAGWGLTKVDGTSPNKLQEIALTIISNDKCDEKIGDITEKKLCILNAYGEGTCYGDSGSPLVIDGVQVGLDSYHVSSCAVGLPVVFTRVSSYVNWINQVQEKYNVPR